MARTRSRALPAGLIEPHKALTAGVGFAWHDRKDEPFGRFRMNEALWSHGLGGRMRLRAGVKPSLILTSPYRRAVQTRLKELAGLPA